MAKCTLTDESSGYQTTAQRNANYAAIEAAFDLTLFRDGTSPNGMLANLDMNSKRIINIGAPEDNSDAVRYIDLINSVANPSIWQGSTLFVDNIVQMKALTGLTTGVYIQVAGYYTKSGMGGGLFYYDSTSIATVDDGAIIAPNTISGRFLRVNSSEYTPQMWGAKADGVTDDAPRIQAALNYLSSYNTLSFPSGNYLIGSTLTIPTSYIEIKGKAKITAKSNTNFEYMMLGTSVTGVSISGLEFDANKSGRSTGQNIRFMGVGFLSSVDCSISEVTVRNCLGYNGIPSVGIFAAGQSVRCHIKNCTMTNCGGNNGTDASDGVFTSGTQNVISGCIASNCTDTGFVIESSNLSIISGCTSYGCSAGGAITNATSDNKYGNIIDGLAIFNWDASNTGGIQVGVPASTSGNLLASVISNITMYAETSGGYGSGAAINVRNLGVGKAVGVTISNVRVLASLNQGILVSGDGVTIQGCNIQSTTDACIQIQSGSDHFISGNFLKGGSFGVVTLSNSNTVVQNNHMISNAIGVMALDTSIVNCLMNKITTPSSLRFDKAAGATINLVGVESNDLMINNATGTAPTGTMVNKFVITDKSGSPIGVVPIYNT